MDLVWVFIECASDWHRSRVFNELEWSVKSAKKFLPDPRCFVAGDKPDFDIEHIETPQRVETHRTNFPRHFDNVNKLLAIVDDPRVSDDFVMMYDDIFLLQSMTYDDIKFWGKAEITYSLEEYYRTRFGSNIYRELWKRTYNYLCMDAIVTGKKVYDWETHLPRKYNKSKLMSVIDRYKLGENPMIVSSAYAYEYADETVIMDDSLQADLYTHMPGMDLDKQFEKKFLNLDNDAIVPPIIDRIIERCS